MGDKASPYQRIMRAAHEGKGVHFDADTVFLLSLDDAIATRAANEDDVDAGRPQRFLDPHEGRYGS